MPDNTRIETLEVKIAHLERSTQELSDVIYRQQQQLDRLAGRYQQLVGQLETLSDRLGPEAPEHEKPPHY